MGIFSTIGSLFGPIGTAVGAVGDGFLSANAEKKQARAQRAQELSDVRLNLTRVRESAEKAGFNPLTALRAGVSGMPNPTPALASGAFVSQALNTASDTYFNQRQQQRDVERDALEKSLMRQELSNMQLQGKAFEKSMQFGYAIPQSNNYSGVDRVQASPALSATDGPRSISGDALRVANVDVVKNEAFSDAQSIEDRYGDVASWIYGMGAVAGDAFSTVRKFNVPFLSNPFEDMRRLGLNKPNAQTRYRSPKTTTRPEYGVSRYK